MSESDLTEEELRLAAAEAGISPQELRLALAQRQGNLPAHDVQTSVLGPPRRGASCGYVEGRIPLPPVDALTAVRKAIERETTARGHLQGPNEADIVDERSGLTYRIRSISDESQGALVRIDIDDGQGRGTQALATTGAVGLTATLVVLGWLFGNLTLLLAGAVAGTFGALVMARTMAKLRRSTVHAREIAASVLAMCEDPLALPPADRSRSGER
jgi:hypothetical protein